MNGLKGFGCLMLVFAVLCALPAKAAAQQKVFLILWHGLAWEDIQASPFYNEGIMAVGTMNTCTGGGEPVTGAYLTIACGSRAFGVADAALMLHSDEQLQGHPAGEVYTVRTGRSSQGDAIVNPQIAAVEHAFDQASYPLELGALADSLRQAGLGLGVFGNSDLSDHRVRWAALVGMDSWGTAAGYVSCGLLLDDAGYPHGKRTDYTQLLAQVSAAAVDCAIIDLGDPYRLDALAPFLLPEQYQKLKARAAQEAWEFISGLHKVFPQAEMLIISPYPDYLRAGQGQWLAPVVIIGRGAGMLTSGTTKWPGLVSNIDAAPTVVEAFGLDRGHMLGRAVTLDPMDTREAVEVVRKTEARIFTVHRHRNQVLRWLIGVQIGLYLLTLAFLIIPRVLDGRIIRMVQFGLLVCMSLPLMLLVLPQGWYWPAAAVLGLLLLERSTSSLPGKLMLIALASASLVMFDVLRGSWWMRYSILGYDPVGGARYYGLGNEYMGILIGSLIMGWAILKDAAGAVNRYGGWDLLLFLAAGAVIALPQWGTNVGGTIAAICGFGAAWLMARRKIGLKGMAMIAALICAALVLLMLLDSNRPDELQSHIGQTKALINRKGFAAIAEIINRKLSTNLRLLRYSIWSRVLIIGIAAMGASLFWPSRYLHWLIRHHPGIVVGIAGTLAATVGALIFNDSGVVAAATCSLYAATTMLALALSLKHNLLPAQPHVEQDPDRQQAG
ncbi:MAG: hypothetical protein QM380_02035 [Bacillota bacterium]|nr:hypothetical protein [Bacillota bacterium]